MQTEATRKLSFVNDYSEGCHPRILDALSRSNLEQLPGYGEDAHCARAAALIREAVGDPSAQVWFLAGGTQSNQIVLSALLRNYEGAVAAETGHIAVHEAGAIERTGHKVLTLPAHAGKLDAAELERFLDRFYADPSHEHMVIPGLVYLSWPTELGTLYSAAELRAISALCRRRGLPLFLDGARLGSGLASPACDLTLPELAKLVDVFYIGGTKMGALLGEAVVFPGGKMPPHFVTTVKQHGGLLAKGRVLGVQFETLFTDGLYLELGRNAVERAEELKALFRAKGYSFFLESPTNQQFLILEDRELEALAERVAFSYWERYDETRSVVRFCTSWATTPEQIQALAELL